jgi:hypothetical protein
VDMSQIRLLAIASCEIWSKSSGTRSSLTEFAGE